MPKTLDERDSQLTSLSCRVRWPKSHFKRTRRHVELIEFGETTLKIHLEICIPGVTKEAVHQREDELNSCRDILRLYADHPDVESGLRKASEIWLSRHGVEMPKIEGSFEDRPMGADDEGKLMSLFKKVKSKQPIEEVE